MIAIAIVLSIIGAFLTYKVALWTYRCKYDDYPGCPTPFLTGGTPVRLLYWIVPITLLGIVCIIVKNYAIILFLVFLMASSLGARQAKEEIIIRLTKIYILDKGLSEPEARYKAGECLKAMQWAKRNR